LLPALSDVHMSFVRRVHKHTKSDYELRHACPSVHMEELGYQWTDFNKILYLNILRKSVEKIKFSLKSDKNKGTLHEDLCAFMVICCRNLLRIGYVLENLCRQNHNTHFKFNNIF